MGEHANSHTQRSVSTRTPTPTAYHTSDAGLLPVASMMHWD